MPTIDAEVDPQTVPDTVVLKLDVEGSETTVLEGLWQQYSKRCEGGTTVLLVEDFVDNSMVSYLSDWSLSEKLTPYNSFWSIQRKNFQICVCLSAAETDAVRCTS